MVESNFFLHHCWTRCVNFSTWSSTTLHFPSGLPITSGTFVPIFNDQIVIQPSRTVIQNSDANSLFSSVLGFGILLKILNFTFLSLLISVFHCLPKTTLAFLVCWSVLYADQDPVFILRSMQRSCGLGRSRKLQMHELQGVLVGCTLHQLDYFPLFRFTTLATSTEFSDRY